MTAFKVEIFRERARFDQVLAEKTVSSGGGA